MLLVCPSCKQPFKPKPTQTSEYCSHDCRNHRYRLNPALFWDRVNKGPHPKGCWEWTGYRQKFGHGSMGRMLEDGRRVYILTHRHAWELVNGPVPEGKWVCHHCDNPPCCNPEHLYLGVRADNVRDIYVRERDKRRLSRETVLAIRADLAVETGRGAVKRIADKHGTLDNIVSSIKHGRKYAYYK